MDTTGLARGLGGKRVRVARPSAENSGAQGVIGIANWIGLQGTGGVDLPPVIYSIDADEEADKVKVEGMRFLPDELDLV